MSCITYYDDRLLFGWKKDNSKSVGGKIKEAGKVIETFQQYEKSSMNVNWPLETFGRVLGKFDETKTRTVREMGFGTLFYAVGKRLPRLLAYWLCTRVDVDKKCLRTTDVMCLDVSYGGDIGHPLKVNDYFLAKRKREEDDEVIADIDDEDLAWITIDVKERRTLVKEEYAYQKKKKSGKVVNEVNVLNEEEVKRKMKNNKKSEGK
uniref:Uncharacterized protein n=1 Tax=Chenopodium quinoa TaxID=63459 RepID=A0A803MP74_CHEQI